MVGAATRIAHYTARMASSLIDPVLTAVNAQAKLAFAAYAIEWTALQQAVHDYLDGEGCLPAEYFNYDAYAGEVYHVSKHFNGAAAIAATADLIIRWKGYGCTEVRLKAIASTVFGIVVP